MLKNFFKRRYKIDLWAKGYEYISAYYKVWWWPFWLYCYSGTHGMCISIKEAERQAIEHKNSELPKYLDI